MEKEQFLISLFSAFKVVDIDRMSSEHLESFLLHLPNCTFLDNQEFENVEAVKSSLNLLEKLNIIKSRRGLGKRYYINAIKDEESQRVLALSDEDDIVSLLALGLRYKQAANKMGEQERISYEEKYSVITDSFTKGYLSDEIKLINTRRKDK